MRIARWITALIASLVLALGAAGAISAADSPAANDGANAPGMTHH